MTKLSSTAVIGAGLIGASWTALFAAAGKNVRVYDVAPDTELTVTAYIESVKPALKELGLLQEKMGAISFHDSVKDAVQGVGFVQENVPERLPIKHATYRAMEAHLSPDCIVASSASGLEVNDMQKGWKDPSRFILGHPFNPPHIIPLVELLANEKTAAGVLEIAESFYQEIGKVTIRVNREVPAHVGNRLQAAVWREAIYLVESGVASVEDVDKAMWAGPGLRWAAMGPHMLFNLGAGAGGMEEFCNRYADSFHTWWDSLGDAKLTPEVSKVLSEGLAKEVGEKTLEELAADRNKMLTAMIKATQKYR